MSDRYIYLDRYTRYGAGRTPYRAPQKFPSKRLRHRIGVGTHRRNDWGAEWYKRAREIAAKTQARQKIVAALKGVSA